MLFVFLLFRGGVSCLCVFKLLIVVFVSCAFAVILCFWGTLFLMVLRFCFFVGVFLVCVWSLFVFVAPFPSPPVVFHVLCVFVNLCVLFVA